MQHFYDGQIRRYITQTIRVLSNFVVKYGDGTLVRVPVMYGDADRQVASILRGNSENKVNSVPRIAVYVSALDIDRDRLSDPSFIDKTHIRERNINNGVYGTGQGRNYTVEKLMPTPFKLTMKVDIWTANTDQKLQILEQILVLFNPSLELQTTDNYVDWTSLSVLNLNAMSWSSKSVPVGNDTPIDIATITLDTPIWISPPVKVKHLGVITKIVTSLYNSAQTSDSGYIEGLGSDPAGSGTTSVSNLLSTVTTTISGYQIQVYNNPQGVGQVKLLGEHVNAIPRNPSLDISIAQDIPIDWEELFEQHPGQYHAGSSTLYLTQPNGSSIVGTIAINPLDQSILTVNWDPDTLVSNTGIDSNGIFDFQQGYDSGGSSRPNSPGTFDAIINPLTYNPKRPNGEDTNQPIAAGTRFLIIDDIGNVSNTDGADAWKSVSGQDLVAVANDIIEWNGSEWSVIFNSTQNADTMVWQTNIYTGVQYLWNGISWVKSFEGEYKAGAWRIEL